MDQNWADIRSDGGGDEELGTIGVLARVGHAKNTLLGVPQLEVLILELRAVDGLSTSALFDSR
jgi:hypothetical protein